MFIVWVDGTISHVRLERSALYSFFITYFQRGFFTAWETHVSTSSDMECVKLRSYRGLEIPDFSLVCIRWVSWGGILLTGKLGQSYSLDGEDMGCGDHVCPGSGISEWNWSGGVSGKVALGDSMVCKMVGG